MFCVQPPCVIYVLYATAMCNLCVVCIRQGFRTALHRFGCCCVLVMLFLFSFVPQLVWGLVPDHVLDHVLDGPTWTMCWTMCRTMCTVFAHGPAHGPLKGPNLAHGPAEGRHQVQHMEKPRDRAIGHSSFYVKLYNKIIVYNYIIMAINIIQLI